MPQATSALTLLTTKLGDVADSSAAAAFKTKAQATFPLAPAFKA